MELYLYFGALADIESEKKNLILKSYDISFSLFWGDDNSVRI